MIGFKALEGYYDNYLYVQDADVSLSTITAKVVFTDGTAKTLTLTDNYDALAMFREAVGQYLHSLAAAANQKED